MIKAKKNTIALYLKYINIINLSPYKNLLNKFIWILDSLLEFSFYLIFMYLGIYIAL